MRAMLQDAMLQTPSGGEIFKLAAPDGWPLRCGIWRPAGKALGTVLLLEGRTEFIEKYNETIGDLLARRFAVLIFDWRGQGASWPERWIGSKDDHFSFDTRIDDLARIMAGPLDELPRPHFALAHSMGAHLLLRRLSQAKTSLSAAVLTAAMLEINFRGLDPIVRALARFAVWRKQGDHFAIGQVEYGAWNWSERRRGLMTSDAARFGAEHELIRRNPRLGLGGVSWRWLRAAWASAAKLTAPGVAERIDLPILMTRHGQDRVVKNVAITRLANRMPHATLKGFPESRHEILIERDEIRNAFLAAFDDFVRPFLPPEAP